MKNTRRYLETLGTIYKEKGLKAAVAHDIVATASSLISRVENMENYTFAIGDDLGNSLFPFGANLEENRRLWGKVKRENSRLQVKINDEDLVKKEGRDTALGLAGAGATLGIVGAILYGASVLGSYSEGGGGPF